MNTDDIMSWKQIQERAIIGLVSIAITYIDRGEVDKARDTMMGIINTLEGQVEA
tara:strand:- start:42 stop:203 length:162 start_codon:yes stop_codon:yes gene_type:complete